MSRNKELLYTYFAEKSEWGVLGEEYTIVDEPYLGYRCHLNKLSCGWRPLFQKHRAFDSFRKLEAFYRVNITLRQSRLSGVARATFPDKQSHLVIN